MKTVLKAGLLAGAFALLSGCYYEPYGYVRGDGYYGDVYYVDYQPYGLAPPPQGYRWNRVGNDVYLVSVRDGLIAQAVYSLFR